MPKLHHCVPVLAIAATAMLLLTGCAAESTPGAASKGSSGPAAATQSAASDASAVVGIAGANYAIEGARAQYEALAAGLENRGLEFEFSDAKLDINRQVSQIDQFVSDDVDAIVVNAAGDPNALVAPLERATDAGIELFAIGAVPGVDDILAEVDLPSEELGQKSGSYFCDATGGDGDIAMIEAIDIPVLAARWDSFEATIAEECPELNVVAVERAIPDDAATTRPIAEDLLTRFPDLAGIWTMGDGPALGAGLAAEAAGKDIIITGLNAETPGIDGIEQGVIDATWDLLPTEIGLQLSEKMADILDGTAPAPSETDVSTVSDLPEWNSENVDEYVPYDERVDYPGLQ